MTFLDALAATEAPSNTTGLEAVAQGIVRDPLNAVSAFRAPAAISKLGKLGASAVKAGVPVGLLYGAQKYADGAGVGEASREGLTSAGVGAVLGAGGELVAPYANKLMGGTAKWLADTKLDKKAGEIASGIANKRNPFHLSAEEQLERGRGNLGALLQGSVSQAPTVGEATKVILDKLAESGYEKSANDRLVSLMKPAPAARDHLEVKGLREALDADPTMFDQITSLRDLFGTTSDMAKRTLKNREATLGPIWDKAARDYENTRNVLDDLLSRQDRRSDITDRWRKLQRASEPSNLLSPEYYGLSVRDVRDRALENARQAVNRGDWGGDAAKLDLAIDNLARRYARPDDMAGLVDAADFESMLDRIMPLGTAHKRKSNLFKYAYETGDPTDELSNVNRFAADLFGKSHNEAHDALISKLDEKAPGFVEKLPLMRLPEPPISAEDVASTIQFRKTRRQLERAFEAPDETKSWDDILGAHGKKPATKTDFLADAYGLQRDYLTGKRGDLTTDELLSTINRDPSVDAFLNQRAQDARGEYLQRLQGARDQGLERPSTGNVREADVNNLPATLESINKVVSRLSTPEFKLPDPTMAQDATALARNAKDARKAASLSALNEDLRLSKDAADQNLKALATQYAPRIEDIIGALPKLKEARGGLLKSISGIRAADAASRPWYKINDALERAYYTRGNSRASEIKPAELIAKPLIGAVLGAAGMPLVDLMTQDKTMQEILNDNDNDNENDVVSGLLKDAALGGALGLGLGSRWKLGDLADKNPGATKLLKYVHGLEPWRNTQISKDFVKQLPKTATLQTALALEQWISDLVSSETNRLRLRNKQDAPVDSTSTIKLADKRKKGE